MSEVRREMRPHRDGAPMEFRVWTIDRDAWERATGRAGLTTTARAMPPGGSDGTHYARSASERRARRRSDRRNDGFVLRVIDADRETRATRNVDDHRGLELEAQEMHRRGLGLGLARQILVGDRMHPRAALDADPDAMLDADEAFERRYPLAPDPRTRSASSP